MKREQIKKTSTIFFAIVIVTALFAVNLITASQNASAAVVVHHKVATRHVGHTASKDRSGSISVHKVIAVIPETHGITTTVALHKKGHAASGGISNSNTVIGGMIVD
jgi:hypothetical protein